MDVETGDTAALVEARVDAATKAAAEAVLAAEGLTMSQFIGGVLKKIAAERVVHCDMFLPSAETLAAMNEPMDGLPSFATVEELFEHLNREDDDKAGDNCKTT